MIKELRTKNDPILKQATIHFDFNDQSIKAVDFAALMRYNMCMHRGIGLSAPQIGYNYSVFCVGNPDVEESVMTFFNPLIVHESVEKTLMDEGCLSFPNLILKVKRPKEIRVRYRDETGETKTGKFTGMTARIIQHEHDHLFGTTFDTRVSSLMLNKGKSKKKILDRRNKGEQRVR